MTIAERSFDHLAPDRQPNQISSQNPSQKLDQKKLWLAAIKPPMYSVAIIPITTGTAIAYYETAAINWSIFSSFLVGAVLILVWENLCNDVFDAETGIDKNKHHSLVNLTGKKQLILAIANICLISGIGLVLSISWQQQDFVVVGIISLCCFLGYTYQGHPFRLGYQGWGEIISFFCFGPLAVSAAYYSQTQSFSITALFASVIIGITTGVILFCSHFHQLEDDLAAGKRSPIVRLGTQRASELLPWFAIIVFAVTAIGLGLGIFPLLTGLVFLTLAIAMKLTNFVSKYHNQPAEVISCKFIAVAWHFWSGLLLGLGFIIHL
jgi:2-carboxy-1,4-naphthoquinone phytyltransferase